MSDDEELTSRLRAGLAREGAAVEPHTDVADLTDRIATRSRRNQRVLSVAAALLLICGVATGVAVGRSTAKHPTQTASAPTSGGPTAAAPEVAGPTSNAAGEAVNLGVLAKVLSRTANGVTLRVYSVGASTVGGPVESQKSGAVPAPTTAAVPGPCNVSTERFQVEASSDAVATSTAFTTTLAGQTATASEQVVGAPEGAPFAVVVVRGEGAADQRVEASLGSTNDVAVATALPDGAGWLATLALPLEPGTTALPSGIAVGWVPATSGSEHIATQLTLTNQASTENTPLPMGPACGPVTGSTLPGSGECLKLQAPGAGAAACPKTTLPPTCTTVSPGGPPGTAHPDVSVPGAMEENCTETVPTCPYGGACPYVQNPPCTGSEKCLAPAAPGSSGSSSGSVGSGSVGSNTTGSAN